MVKYTLLDFTCYECGGHNFHKPNCSKYKNKKKEQKNG